MKRVFRTRHFSRWMRKTALEDKVLCQSVSEMEQGLIDANLGGNVFKKRVPLPGQGKRGSLRTLLATNLGRRWFFILGFSKNEKENISHQELLALQTIAEDLLQLTSADLDAAVIEGKLQEICHGKS